MMTHAAKAKNGMQPCGDWGRNSLAASAKGKARGSEDRRACLEKPRQCKWMYNQKKRLDTRRRLLAGWEEGV